jgi:hypothetical protein
MPSRFRQSPPFTRIPLNAGAPLSPWKKIAAVLAGSALFVLALMFSVVLFAVVLTVGVVVWSWFWWKTRGVRRQMREQGIRPGDAPAGVVVLEGEVIREVREEDLPPRR